MTTSRSPRLRIIAPALAALLLVALLLLGMAAYYRFVAAGISNFVKVGMTSGNALRFAAQLLTREVLPIYLLTAFGVWFVTLGWGALGRCRGGAWTRDWTGPQAFALSLAGLCWIHLCLWWQVPTALWVLPGMAKLPFWLLLPALGVAVVVPGKEAPLRFLVRSGTTLDYWEGE